MPVRRERAFIIAATTFSVRLRPPIVASKRPQRRPLRCISRTSVPIADGRSRESACRNSRTSPLAVAAPAFICAARPRCATNARSANGAASASVESRLPPSTTMISWPSARNGCSGASVATMPRTSSSAGTMIETRTPRLSPPRVSRARRRSSSPVRPCSRSNARPPRWARCRSRRRAGPSRGAAACRRRRAESRASG